MPDKPKILIADDEGRMRDLLKMYLEAENYAVKEAATGVEVLAHLDVEQFSLLILDIMMPELDGFSVCRQVRQKQNLPIIILTAKGEEVDRILGFELGADDYVVKPFSPRELMGRVKALLRRSSGAPAEVATSVTYHGLAIDPSSRKVTVNGQPITLTPKEFDLLWFLVNRPGKVFSREQLMEQVWGYSFFGSLRTVDTHVKRLREKLSGRPESPEYLATIWGVGYKFEVVQ
ncbi:MAG: response regulator transcription factor [Actinobacteria bacterium]|nr:response regulator transcription factor [Actinomycetota bacterium]